MWRQPTEEQLLEKAKGFSKTAGIILMLLGAAGFIFPLLMTYTVILIIAFVMLTAGITAGYFTWVSDRSNWIGWLKSLTFVAFSLFLILYPDSSAAALGLLLTAYFFIDAFSGFALTFSLYPDKGWVLWFINALMSLMLGIIFLAGWPFSSPYLVGLFVGISLFFDGVVLFATGNTKQESKKP